MGQDPPEIVDWGRVSYREALCRQRERWESVACGTGREAIILLEHDATVTLGRSGGKEQLRVQEGDLGQLGVELWETERGGGATYHGPGQAVVYPIVSLARFSMDVHAYLRSLEEGLIQACQILGVSASRRQGLTGVWVEERKIGFIGVAVRRAVTFHGAALNVLPVKKGFDLIRPCGFDQISITSLSEEGGEGSMQRVKTVLGASLLEAFLSRSEPLCR